MFRLRSEKDSIKAIVSEPVASSMSSSNETSTEDFSELEWLIVNKFIPSNSFGTNLACVFFSGISHYVYGIFFNAYESVNSRYDYPNIGSMCFVLATALYLIRLNLTLERLPIEVQTWKYSIYRILAVTFLTHLILAGIWQQLVNLTWELTFIIKDCIDMLYHTTENMGFLNVSSYITMKTARWITYVEGVGILTFVLFSLNSRSEYEF